MNEDSPHFGDSKDIEEVELRTGEQVVVRPIRPEDEPAMVRFHESLSERSVHLRYFHFIACSERVAHQRLAQVCSGDQNKELVIIAETADKEIAGVGRLNREGRDAEFALVVADTWQHRGIGTALLSSLIAIGRREGVERIYGSVLADNQPMLKACARLGFGIGFPEGGVIEASLPLV